VACNTLAVLFPDTRFSKTGRVPVQGIVETGVNRLLRELERFPRSIATIFGTVTTIEEQTYPTLLQLNGIHENRIIPQACPSLADTISEDRRGMRTKEKIEKYVALAISKAQERTTSYLTYLACTHYGYRKEQFSNAFKGHGVDVMVLNPNELVIDDLFRKHKRKCTEVQKNNDVEVEFVTRYKIPEPVLETIAYFLDDVSPKTVQAFTNYTYAPNLF
jgi:glutamate racemase